MNTVSSLWLTCSSVCHKKSISDIQMKGVIIVTVNMLSCCKQQTSWVRCRVTSCRCIYSQTLRSCTMKQQDNGWDQVCRVFGGPDFSVDFCKSRWVKASLHLLLESIVNTNHSYDVYKPNIGGTEERDWVKLKAQV